MAEATKQVRKGGFMLQAAGFKWRYEERYTKDFLNLKNFLLLCCLDFQGLTASKDWAWRRC